MAVVTQGTFSRCCGDCRDGLRAVTQGGNQRGRMDLFPKHRQLNAPDVAFVQSAPPSTVNVSPETPKAPGPLPASSPQSGRH